MLLPLLDMESTSERKSKKEILTHFTDAQEAINNEVLKLIKENEPVKVGDISELLKDVSRNTIKKDISYLKIEIKIANEEIHFLSIFILKIPK